MVRAPKKLRWMAAGLIIIVATGVGVLIGWFIPDIFSDPDRSNKSGYLGTVLGGIGLVLVIVPAVSVLVRDPKPDTLLAQMRRKQRGALVESLKNLQLDQEAELSLRLGHSGSSEEWDVAEMTDRILAGERLILIGAPGSGKSYFAVQLALRAVERSDEIAPVIVPLSSWRHGSDIEGWLGGYVSRVFNIYRVTAEELVRSGQILPIFDGLDEIEDARGPLGDVPGAFVEALVRWRVSGQPASFVLTSQRPAWARLEERLRKHHTLSVLDMRSIQYDDAKLFLARSIFGFDDALGMQTVLNELQPGPDGNNLRLPWRLAMISRAMRPWVLPGGLLGVGAEAELLRISQPDELVKAFVLACSFPITSNKIAYALQPLQLWWLSRFAKYLESNNVPDGRWVFGRRLSFRDLELHRLWPIAGKLRPRIVDLAMCLLMSLPGLVWGVNLLWDRGLLGRMSVCLGVVVWCAMLVRTSMKPWVPAANWGWQRLREPKFYARQVGAALILGATATLLFDLVVGLWVFITAWVIVGLVVGFGQTLATDSELRIVDPFATLRNERRISRISAWALGPLIAAGLSLHVQPLVAILLAAGYCFLVGETVGCALWRRYIATILSSPLSVPPSPRRVLERARDRGLVRSVGQTYQFRRDEVRVYLASRTAGRFSRT